LVLGNVFWSLALALAVLAWPIFFASVNIYAGWPTSGFCGFCAAGLGCTGLANVYSSNAGSKVCTLALVWILLIGVAICGRLLHIILGHSVSKTLSYHKFVRGQRRDKPACWRDHYVLPPLLPPTVGEHLFRPAL
jgi:hypothetical protein